MKNKTTKIKALSKYLEFEVEDINQVDDLFTTGNKEYLVLTDKEADEKTKEYILDSVWAFNKSFLDGHSDIIAEIDDKTWATLVDRCESSNKAVLAMIPDKDYFVEDAINADGRGHFINSYDGKEEKKDGYYIYRVN